MSWYKDPQLFVYWSNYVSRFRILRIRQEYSLIIHLHGHEWYSDIEDFNFSQHFALGSNKESDYDAFKASFPRNTGQDQKLVNCQGLVVNWNETTKLGTWSREELDAVFYSLPGLSLTGPGARLLAEKKALEKIVSELQAENSFLKDEVRKERDEKSALTSKLKECCGAEGEEPRIGGDTVPSNWVPFEDLDVQTFGKNIPLTITKAIGATKISQDETTNVRGNCFYRGVFPLVIVNVDELIPNEKARFDPEFWGSYNNKAGIRYAARKLLKSEV